jgi:hypothetical protein
MLLFGYVINVTHKQDINSAGLCFFAYVETIAGSQKETGGYCSNGAEHPEHEEACTVGTDTADIVFGKDNGGVKCGEEKNGSDARGDE